MPAEPRLLCIDLQTAEGAGPEARAVFGARQLLSIARRCGWQVIHTRLRTDAVIRPSFSERQATALRPLITERVFLRSRRSSADCPALIDQLDQWAGETVYIAAFDPLALLALLIDRADRGPNFVLVDEAISASQSHAGRAAIDPIRAAAQALAPQVTISALVDALNHRPANEDDGAMPPHPGARRLPQR